jgi:aryl-alcohol dehydrogenase-like predicted oxidoreductase
LHLVSMQHEGKIDRIGVTNFDTPHLRSLLDAGVPVVTHQVQLSLLDRRALGEMSALCGTSGVRLLAFGALAGGFLHERWLGVAAPSEPLENRSLVKYRLIIEECGGWEALQRVLVALGAIAARHGTTIGTVALRWVLDQRVVSAAIVGARNAAHLRATLDALALALSAEDAALLDRVLGTIAGPPGDVYALEREVGGRHAAIMRYGLNRAAAD